MSIWGHLVFGISLLTGLLYADTPMSGQAYELAKELRCVVCQNQSVAESDAGIAQDMRSFIRMELDKGRDKQEIIDELVDSYGEFIIFTPTFTSKNYPLWILPVIVFLGVIIRIRKNRYKTT